MLLQQYQDSWENDFNRIEKVIQKNLSGVAVKMEHIGSTAVKHLAAKPIIDIDIVYDDPKLFVLIKKGLEELGYDHNGDQGIAGREVFKRNVIGKNHPILDSIKHHLYVCHANNEELHRHLMFRDFLRGNEQERKAYEALKFKIAELTHQDKKAYAALKETMARGFVESILEKAANGRK